MTLYYHIDNQLLTIISGPHPAQSAYIKKLTHCGNPEILDLAMYDLVPQVYATLADGQKHGDPVVYADRVEIPAIPKSAEELVEEVQMNIQHMTTAAGDYISRYAHWSAGPMIYDKAKQGKMKSKAISDWTFAVWGLYYQRLALLEAGGAWDDAYLDFTPAGPCPYPIKQAMEE